jgi:hypothetical protein
VRNILPYRAVQAYDRVPMWVSYLLMIFVGGYVIMLFLEPALLLVFHTLNGVGSSGIPVQ